ncbi:MAG: hypothetical protein JG769_109 [Oscillospiraceae bacterium]|jgi:hypothetical protein|nr:hypothetical protein [Oscillospiraceae bacterium]
MIFVPLLLTINIGSFKNEWQCIVERQRLTSEKGDYIISIKKY